MIRVLHGFMKRILFILLIITCYGSNAQHYQCLQSGAKHYFTNRYGYLRGMRIDSVRSDAGDNIFLSFSHTEGQLHHFVF